MAIFSDFSPYREILPSTIHMPNFRSIGPFRKKLQRRAESAPPPLPYQFAKSPACLGLMSQFLIKLSSGLLHVKLYCNHQSEKSMNKKGCFLNQDTLVLTFHFNLRTTVPFATAHLEIFHCTHHSVIAKSNLYFTFCSTLNTLFRKHQSNC